MPAHPRAASAEPRPPQTPRAHWRPQQNGRRPHSPTAGWAPPARNYSSQQPPRPAPRGLLGIAVLPPPTFGLFFCRGASVNANRRSPRRGVSQRCLVKETKKKKPTQNRTPFLNSSLAPEVAVPPVPRGLAASRPLSQERLALPRPGLRGHLGEVLGGAGEETSAF